MKKVVECLERYYVEEGQNCAETIFSAAVEAWELDLSKEALKCMAGFGGGMGCASVCGAVTGGVAALSLKYTEEGGGHNSLKLMEKVRYFIKTVRQELGSDLCKDLHPKYASKEKRCLPTITKVAEILDLADGR